VKSRCALAGTAAWRVVALRSKNLMLPPGLGVKSCEPPSAGCAWRVVALSVPGDLAPAGLDDCSNRDRDGKWSQALVARSDQKVSTSP